MTKLRAYVLIETRVSQTPSVQTALKKIKEVVSINPVTGPYDIIILVEATDPKSMGRIVLEKIRPLPGVETTLTCVVMA